MGGETPFYYNEFELGERQPTRACFIDGWQPSWRVTQSCTHRHWQPSWGVAMRQAPFSYCEFELGEWASFSEAV